MTQASPRCTRRTAPRPSALDIAWVLALGLSSQAAFAEAPFDTPAEDADAVTLIAYLEGLAKPTVEFASREEAKSYRLRAAQEAADVAQRVIDGEATDQQLGKAIVGKAAALRVLADLGSAARVPTPEQFLGRLLEDDRPAVVSAALAAEVSNRVRRWRTLSRRGKKRLFNTIARVVERTDPTVAHLRLVTYLADTLGDSPDRDRVVALVDRLRPRLASASGEESAAKLAALDGVVRRLRLPGQPIEVEGQLLSGSPVDWPEYRGKVVLIDYWATWCGLCHMDLPTIQAMHERYGDQGFEVLGVSLDDDPEAVQAFLAKHEVPWPTLVGHDEQTRGWNHPMVHKYGIHNLPRAILIDRSGHVVSINARGRALEQQLDQLFREAPVAATPVAEPVRQTADAGGYSGS